MTMPAPERIRQLIETFEQNLPAYRAGKNETELRRQFLDPFFEALGWDVDNRKGYDERRKEVEHEHSVEIDGQQKKADYAFRTGRDDFDFLVEAKKPSVKIESSLEAAFQLRRYGWSAGLPINILTDFEHFAVYDCRQKPNLSKDKAATGRVMLVHYKEYVEKWDEIAAIFSPEAIRRGALDRWKDDVKGKKGTQEVDEAFLEEIEAWREALARNIALRNKPLGLDEEQLNFAVQMTIDRIIFLRIAEERGMEKERLLWDAAFPPFSRGNAGGSSEAGAGAAGVYPQLLKLFAEADSRYNSGLFHFKKEKGRENPDDLTPRLTIDDKVLKDIIKGLYYPSPYSFSYIPAEILGSVYERFLGKVIRLTVGGNAKVEEKPEVRKAGGVYYTPSYIVDYIVKNTVGKLVNGELVNGELVNGKPGKGMTPEDAAQIKIVDPACGSGSFLLGAFRYLLDWHLDWYVAHNPEKYVKSGVLLTADGKTYRLGLEEKKRILLNNIHGVDLDPQAVEVRKLSLLLKVVEDPGQLKMFEEGRILPNLDKNIKNGNALIGPDYFAGQMFPDLAELKRVRPFDWQAEFPEVFKRGGFDAVIGNPPYAYRNATEELLRDYYLRNYEAAEGNFELYKFFIENNLRITRENGLSGIIVSATFLVQPSFQKLRRSILANSCISELSPLGPGVFEDAIVDTTILIMKKSASSQGHKIKIKSPEIPSKLSDTTPYYVAQERFTQNAGLVFDYKLSDTSSQIIQKMFEHFPNIETNFEFGVGINTGFIRDELVADYKIDNRYHPMVPGTGISRYGGVNTKGWIMYDKEYVKKRGKLGRTLPAEHLLSSQKILVVRTRNLSLQRRIVATIDSNGCYNLNRLSNIVARPGYSLFGLLGILNSSLFNWLFSTRYYDYEIKPVYLRNSPLADCNNPELVRLVEQMLALHQTLGAARSASERELLTRQIAATDRQIDALVYQLYGLTEEEIRIVEGNQA
jgi:hypothetical protein